MGSLLPGRLGLAEAQVPHADRHGLLWIERGRLSVEDGCLRFATAGGGPLRTGVYSIPYQQVSILLLGPGTAVTHDAMRILSLHGVGTLFVGTGGTRLYAESLPSPPDRADVARNHALIWADPERRIEVARRMYALRLGRQLPPHLRNLDTLRGMEGARARTTYALLAQSFGVHWAGRKYDRTEPNANDPVNAAVNHVATAFYAAARVAVAVTGAIPQLGFVHEASGFSFALDIADLFRTDVTLPTAFAAAKRFESRGGPSLEQVARHQAAIELQRQEVIPRMIDHIKSLLGSNDDCGHSQCP